MTQYDDYRHKMSLNMYLNGKARKTGSNLGDDGWQKSKKDSGFRWLMSKKWDNYGYLLAKLAGASCRYTTPPLQLLNASLDFPRCSENIM